MRVLIVDDEVNIRQTFSEFSRAAGYQPFTARDGLEALDILMAEKQIAVIVSDMNMPKMTGIELLIQVKKISPATARVLITGYAELETAIDAVNEGNIFRFLTKPISKNNFLNAIKAGADQYQLIVAEKELLEKTLQGSIKALTELLSLIDPRTFGNATELRDRARRLASMLGVKNIWQVESAAMLAQIGLMTLPIELRLKIQSDEVLSDQEHQLLQRVPEISSRLISHIPRLEPVGEIVRFANKAYDGSGPPDQALVGEQIPLGSRLLKVLTDLTELEKQGHTFEAAITRLSDRKGQYDEKVLHTVRQKRFSLSSGSDVDQNQGLSVRFSEMRVGDLLLSDVQTTQGKLLLKAGNTINRTLLEGLNNYTRLVGLREPIKIKRLDQTDEEE